MTEQEQKAFDQMREALQIADNIALAGAAYTPKSIEAGLSKIREALTAANAVQPQFMGFDVVVDPTMKPNEMKLVQPQAQGEVSWNLRYADSTPKLNVGHSAFEDWFQQQPFATQIGVKQMCRDSYAAGMGDPLVKYAHPQATEPAGWKRDPLDLGQYVNDAHISANDKPVAVIEKLQAVINERNAHHGK